MTDVAIDFDAELRQLRLASRTPRLLVVPRLSFLLVDGRGAPEEREYQHALQALFALSWTARSHVKAETGRAWKVQPLETLWGTGREDGSMTGERQAWGWTAMIAQPPQVTPEVLAVVRAKVARNLPGELVTRVRLRDVVEGSVAQVAHVGPYATATATTAALQAFIREERLIPHGRHHEIYVSDPRRTPPQRLRTVIRQPVR